MKSVANISFAGVEFRATTYVNGTQSYTSYVPRNDKEAFSAIARLVKGNIPPQDGSLQHWNGVKRWLRDHSRHQFIAQAFAFHSLPVPARPADRKGDRSYADELFNRAGVLVNRIDDKPENVPVRKYFAALRWLAENTVIARKSKTKTDNKQDVLTAVKNFDTALLDELADDWHETNDDETNE